MFVLAARRENTSNGDKWEGTPEITCGKHLQTEVAARTSLLPQTTENGKAQSGAGWIFQRQLC